MTTWIHVDDQSFALEAIANVSYRDGGCSIYTTSTGSEIGRLAGEEAIEFDYKFSTLTGRLMTLGLKATDQQKAQWWEEVLGQNSTYLRQIAQNLISLTNAIEGLDSSQIAAEINDA